MRNAGWYGVTTSPIGPVQEQDGYSCAHCQAITFTKPGHAGPLMCGYVKKDGSVEMVEATRCFSCWEHICPACAKAKECVPKLKAIDLMEREARRTINQVIENQERIAEMVGARRI